MSLAPDECLDDRPPQPRIVQLPGILLRQRREERGLTIDDLARTTKIGKATLRALEESDLSHLPAPIYTRGFVKAYAKEVGLDPDRVADEYVRALQPLSPNPVGPSNEHALPSRTEHERAVPQHRDDDGDRGFTEQQLGGFGWIVTAAAAIGFVLYLASVNRSTERTRTAHPEASDAAHASATQTGAAASSQSPDAANATLIHAPLRIELVTQAECWISARVDGEAVFTRLLLPGERHTLDISDEAVLRVGEPGALTLSINGRSGRPVGPAGQPITVRITKDNFREFLSS
jgi:cytoskeleton protein RodZ